ncbi:CDP-alcohol phosphatidyltransferase family protein [bacterium]|nr:CDP-alcohol phosphatidyltransferase family protein [bacterium]
MSPSADSGYTGTGLPGGTLGAIAGFTVGIFAVLASFSLVLPSYGLLSVALALLLWIAIATLMLLKIRYHPYAKFGTANFVTTGRAATTVVLAGFVPVEVVLLTSPGWMWAIAITASIALCMDGLDGYLARKNASCSVFGARFDMETDALLGLIITLLVWQSGQAGIWVLALGLMRYIFVAASVWLAALREPLFPSLRRKTVCVIQVGALCLMLCPWLSAVQVSSIGAIALFSLIYSFTVDTIWLLTHKNRRYRDVSPPVDYALSLPARSKP